MKKKKPKKKRKNNYAESNKHMKDNSIVWYVPKDKIKIIEKNFNIKL